MKAAGLCRSGGQTTAKEDNPPAQPEHSSLKVNDTPNQANAQTHKGHNSKGQEKRIPCNSSGILSDPRYTLCNNLTSGSQDSGNSNSSSRSIKSFQNVIMRLTKQPVQQSRPKAVNADTGSVRKS